MESPEKAHTYLRDGVSLISGGDVKAAAEAFELGVKLRPGDAVLQFNLGVALHQLQETDRAISAYRACVAVSPKMAGAWFNLTLAYQRQGRLDDAIEAAQRVVALEPYKGSSYRLLGDALQGKGETGQAGPVYEVAKFLDSQPFYEHLNKARELVRQGRLIEAWPHAQTALAIDPNHADPLVSTAVVMLAQDRLAEAIQHLHRALEIESSRAEYWTELGHAHMHSNNTSEAVQAYGQALACQPGYRDAEYGTALAHLIRGNFLPGWPGFETRWNALGPRYANAPVWQGESARDRTILLYAEQGYGDTIFFIRYASMVAERTGTLFLECQPSLKSLMETVPALCRVFGFGEKVPHFDAQLSVFSLPRIFGTTLENAPSRAPYLSVPEQARLDLPQKGSELLRVGLCWAGSGSFLWNQSRSIPLIALKPLWEVPGVIFYSLQAGHGVQELTKLNEPPPLHDLSPLLDDFGATASAIDQLDLVISVDTSIAHLTGALGKPLWLLLPFAPDWRWLLGRSDSPWYPTARLFRPTTRGDWAGVVAEVKEALAKEAERRAAT